MHFEAKFQVFIVRGVDGKNRWQDFIGKER